MGDYYRFMLTTEQKQVYQTLLRSMGHRVIPCKAPVADIHAAMKALLMDHPELCLFEGQWRYENGSVYPRSVLSGGGGSEHRASCPSCFAPGFCSAGLSGSGPAVVASSLFSPLSRPDAEYGTSPSKSGSSGSDSRSASLSLWGGTGADSGLPSAVFVSDAGFISRASNFAESTGRADGSCAGSCPSDGVVLFPVCFRSEIVSSAWGVADSEAPFLSVQSRKGVVS